MQSSLTSEEAKEAKSLLSTRPQHSMYSVLVLQLHIHATRIENYRNLLSLTEILSTEIEQMIVLPNVLHRGNPAI